MRHLILPLGLILGVTLAFHASAGHIVPLDEEGWPQFRGPKRDGVSTETGLLQAWPEGGPQELWRFDGLGKGYSSPIITEHGIFITGDVGEETVLFAFDMDGNLRWKVPNGKAWTESYPGSRASCTYSGGKVYHMNGHGRVVCLDAESGAEHWTFDALAHYGGREIQWGLSECLLVDDSNVYVTPGGPKTFMAALDKHTGAIVWESKPLIFERTYAFGGREVEPPQTDADNAGYASPLLIEIGGHRLIARTSGQHVVILDAEKGDFLWQHHIFARHEVIGAIPVFWNDALYFSAPDEFGGKMFDIEYDQGELRVTERWSTDFDNCHSSMVAAGGKLFGSGYRQRREWVALDAATGEELYTQDDLTQGACIYADGRLYTLGQDGVVSLLAAREDQFTVEGQFRIAEGRRNDVWAHPVLLDGRLYLRDHDTLWCYDVGAE